jgi:hypothetical protein
MDCSRCGESVDLDLMRCQACGHDMLPQDITQRPATISPATPHSEKQFADAISAVQHGFDHLPHGAESDEAYAARIHKAQRDQRAVLIFLAVATAAALVLSRL